MAQHQINITQLEEAMIRSLKVDPTGRTIYEVALRVVFDRPPSLEPAIHAAEGIRSQESPSPSSSQQLLQEAQSTVLLPAEPPSTPSRAPGTKTRSRKRSNAEVVRNDHSALSILSPPRKLRSTTTSADPQRPTPRRKLPPEPEHKTGKTSQ